MSTSPGTPDQGDGKSVNRAALLGAGVGLFVVGVVLIATGAPVVIGVFPIILALLLPLFFLGRRD